MDFIEFYKWIYKEFNIDLNAYNPQQLNRRITSLMSKLGVNSLEKYKKILITDNIQKERFLDFITINVTEFFRNPELFFGLQGVLKDYIKDNLNLKIWSAACSIGCEPYSIAMIIKEIAPNIRTSIIATDIDSNVLNRASKGEYLSIEMKNVNEYYKSKYFSKIDDKFLIDNELKSMITFKKHDLILDSYEKNFDLIVCRNVVIYFKKEVKKEVFRRLSKSLKIGGLLFLGSTEIIFNHKDYNLEKVSTFIYKRA